MKYVVTLNKKSYEVEVNESDAILTAVNDVAAPAPVAAVAAPSAAPASVSSAAPVAAADGTKIISPMPGTILSVSVTAGQSVKAGDVLMVLEAMKMENDIVAPSDGTVKQLLVSKGSTVDTDQVLAVL